MRKAMIWTPKVPKHPLWKSQGPSAVAPRKFRIRIWKIPPPEFHIRIWKIPSPEFRIRAIPLLKSKILWNVWFAFEKRRSVVGICNWCTRWNTWKFRIFIVLNANCRDFRVTTRRRSVATLQNGIKIKQNWWPLKKSEGKALEVQFIAPPKEPFSLWGGD